MELTKQLIKERTNKFKVDIKHNVPAIVGSVFSVVLAMSIVMQLKEIVSGFTLIFLSLFISLFLLQNEIFKVKEVRKAFKGKKKAIVPFLITFFISISMSSIGVYFWTNKVQITEDNAKVEQSIDYNEIEQRYAIKIDSLSSLDFYETNESKLLIKNIEFWKSRRAMDVAELKSIRANVQRYTDESTNSKLRFDENVQTKINLFSQAKEKEIAILENEFKRTMNGTTTNNFVTYIFFALILITEFAIVILNKYIAVEEYKLEMFAHSDLSKKYIVGRGILESLFMTQKKGVVTNAMAIHSLANTEDFEKHEIGNLYNTYILIGILDEGKVKKMYDKRILHNNILVTEEEAMILYDRYFEKMFKIA